MTVILKHKETNQPNSEHGLVVEMFDTVEDFKIFLREELFKIQKNLEEDDIKDEELARLLQDSNRLQSFYEIYDKYLEYFFDYTFEII